MVRLVWEDVAEGDSVWASVSGVVPLELITGPPGSTRIRHVRGMHWSESEGMGGVTRCG